MQAPAVEFGGVNVPAALIDIQVAYAGGVRLSRHFNGSQGVYQCQGARQYYSGRSESDRCAGEQRS